MVNFNNIIRHFLVVVAIFFISVGENKLLNYFFSSTSGIDNAAYGTICTVTATILFCLYFFEVVLGLVKYQDNNDEDEDEEDIDR